MSSQSKNFASSPERKSDSPPGDKEEHRVIFASTSAAKLGGLVASPPQLVRLLQDVKTRQKIDASSHVLGSSRAPDVRRPTSAGAQLVCL
jgi:hypothetical protein